MKGRSDVRYRTFPGTEITASEIGFGAWTVSAGWWGDYTDEDAAVLMRKALELGLQVRELGLGRRAIDGRRRYLLRPLQIDQNVCTLDLDPISPQILCRGRTERLQTGY